jgi:predicted glutamine amidotransferase
MCIAVVKPKNVDFPTTQQLKNCFNSNPHGAGFMYSDGEKLIIKKGYMTFNDFIKAFQEENISKDKLVFFHFRIATHGLIDGGNTHPFPITKSIDLQRNQEIKYKGYGLIHNGVFHYDPQDFLKYDRNNLISDTMLFTIKIKEALDKGIYSVDDVLNTEDAVVFAMFKKREEVNNVVNNIIGYNKVAIMNEKEELFKYGNWIEDNGVFYSNSDYKYEYGYYNYYYHCSYPNFSYEDDSKYCTICCEELTSQNKCETTIGNCCSECCQSYGFVKCKTCDMMIFEEDKAENGCCYLCNENYDYVEDADYLTEFVRT